MTKKWSSTASMDGQTKRQASKAARRVDYSDEVTEAQVEKIDKLLAPEFQTGDWQTVEKE